MLNQQSYILVSATCLAYQVATRSSSPDMTTVFHARLHGRFIEIKSTSVVRNIIERIKVPSFLEVVLAMDTT